MTTNCTISQQENVKYLTYQSKITTMTNIMAQITEKHAYILFKGMFWR